MAAKWDTVENKRYNLQKAIKKWPTMFFRILIFHRKHYFLWKFIRNFLYYISFSSYFEQLNFIQINRSLCSVLLNVALWYDFQWWTETSILKAKLRFSFFRSFDTLCQFLIFNQIATVLEINSILKNIVGHFLIAFCELYILFSTVSHFAATISLVFQFSCSEMPWNVELRIK